MRIHVKYLISRNGSLYFRRRVPEQLVSLVGKREFKRSLSLSVGEEAKAVPVVNRLAKETDRILEEAERRAGQGLGDLELADQAYEWARKNGFLSQGRGLQSGPYEPSIYEMWLEERLRETLARTGRAHESELDEQDFLPATWAKIQTVKKGDRLDVSASIRDAARSYTARHKGGELPKAEQAALDQFVEFAGDRDLKSIRRADARDWINYLLKTREQSPATDRRRLNTIKAIFNRAIDDFELDMRNPFEKQKLPQTATYDASKRLPFNADHLARLDQHIEAHQGSLEVRTLVALLRDSSMRPLEAGGLDWSDVHLDHAVPHVMLRPNEWRGLKTASSTRDVPLSSSALAALRHWAAKAKEMSGPVFSERSRETSKLSDQLNDFIRAAGVPKSSRLTAYSFRHGFEEALRRASVEASLQRYLMGHSAQSMTDNYGAHKPPLELLQEAQSAALGFLGLVDDRNYEPFELLPR